MRLREQPGQSRGGLEAAAPAPGPVCQYGKMVPSTDVGAHCPSLNPDLPPASFKPLNESLKPPLVLNFLIRIDGENSSTYLVGWLTAAHRKRQMSINYFHTSRCSGFSRSVVRGPQAPSSLSLSPRPAERGGAPWLAGCPIFAQVSL